VVILKLARSNIVTIHRAFDKIVERRNIYIYIYIHTHTYTHTHTHTHTMEDTSNSQKGVDSPTENIEVVQEKEEVQKEVDSSTENKEVVEKKKEGQNEVDSPTANKEVVQEKEEERKQNLRSKSVRNLDTGQSNKDSNFNANVQNSFSADSPYFSSYVENEMNSMQIFHSTLNDIAARTKTFGKCGALMSESTRRLALACRLQQPNADDDGYSFEETKSREAEAVADRRRAVGEDMASLLGVMSEVRIQQEKMKFAEENM
jgi:hypothetical protein